MKLSSYQKNLILSLTFLLTFFQVSFVSSQEKRVTDLQIRNLHGQIKSITNLETLAVTYYSPDGFETENYSEDGAFRTQHFYDEKNRIIEVRYIMYNAPYSSIRNYDDTNKTYSYNWVGIHHSGKLNNDGYPIENVSTDKNKTTIYKYDNQGHILETVIIDSLGIISKSISEYDTQGHIVNTLTYKPLSPTQNKSPNSVNLIEKKHYIYKDNLLDTIILTDKEGTESVYEHHEYIELDQYGNWTRQIIQSSNPKRNGKILIQKIEYYP